MQKQTPTSLVLDISPVKQTNKHTDQLRLLLLCCGDDLILQPVPFQSVQRQYTPPSLLQLARLTKFEIYLTDHLSPMKPYQL